MASDFERLVDVARAAYERNDPHAALRLLDRARRSALKRRNEEQLARVLEFAEGVIGRDERTEIEREHFIYGVRQNLRQVTRRHAYEGDREWIDPYPALETARPQTRMHYSTGVKIWIGVAVVLGTIFVVLWALSPLLS
jgi:hypothetical protein